ncbi:MAG TPA: translation elongation factor Ts [Hyphomicrobiales bacterium]|nr:translation elongation factor Ts [Hyphomicrobiales bacterium]
MADITAAMVKELRDKTGAGMMDCKAALGETGGDLEQAVDWLRKKGLSKAAKKAGRVAAEGLIAIAGGGAAAAVAEINSETDFVARNEEFQALARDSAALALATDGNAEAVLAAKSGAGTFADRIHALIAKIGENMTLRRSTRLQVGAGAVGTYLHGSSSPGVGRIGVLVALESEGNAEELAQLGRQIAMHVAAMNPLAIDEKGIDPAVLEREKAILLEKHQGKPAAVQEKIVQSGLKSYFKEVCLLDQPYVHDSAKTVGQAVKEAAERLKAPITVAAFVRYALGEGIEKGGGDFAAEVAAAAAGGH